MDDGLSQSTVWCILQDQNGFLWFGTGDGLNRYDGYSFKVYRHDDQDPKSLPDNSVNCLAGDQDGRIWIGTDAGLCVYDKRTDSFARVADSIAGAAQLSNGQILRLLVDHTGMLWVGTQRGAIMLDPAIRHPEAPRFVLSLPDNVSPVNAMYEDKDGDMWLSSGKSLFRYERKTRQQHDVPIPRSHATIVSIFQDSSGILWFGTANSELISFEPAASRWEIIECAPEGYRKENGNFITAMAEDGAGRFWVGTRIHGLSTFDRRAHLCQRFTPGIAGQRFEGVNALLCDRSKLLWVGYDGAGIVKVRSTPVKFHHLLLPTQADSVTGDNFLKPVIIDRLNALWIGTFDRGLSVYDRRTGGLRRFLHAANDPTTLSSNAILALLEDHDGRVWVGTDGGLDEYDRRTDRFKRWTAGDAHTGDVPNLGGARMSGGAEVRSLCQDSSGNLWVGTATKLLRFDPSSSRFVIVELRDESPQTYGVTWIECIACSPDGTLWLGTNLYGLIHIDATGRVLGRYAHDRRGTLCHNFVKSLHLQESGQLWVGTVDGLNRFDPERGTWLQFHEKDGLPDGTIYGILPAGATTLWMSTNRGLSRMDVRDPEHPVFRNYTPDDGLQSFEFNTKSYFKARDGEMFFGGINGLNTFYPDSITDNPHVPQIVLTGFKKFDRPSSLGSAVDVVEAIELDYTESVFSFEFSSLEYTNPRRNQFAYMMEGLDRQWISCGSTREARYTNLAPGTYTFRVKGSNDDGVWNESGRSVRVTVVPPFWRRLWFLALAGTTAAAAFGGLVRALSVRRLRREIDTLERERVLDHERQATRDRIARDLHDDVSSTLSSMSLYVESSRSRLHGAGNDAAEVLERLHNLARSAEDAMEQAVWSLSSHHDKLSDLIARIRDVAYESCADNDIRCEVNIDPLPEDVALREQVRKNVYLVFRESIANIVKHAGARTVYLGLKTEGDRFVLSIRDDGAGFDQGRRVQKPRGGNGLRNMETRAREIGATLEVTSRPGGATTVVLSMQIAHMRH